MPLLALTAILIFVWTIVAHLLLITGASLRFVEVFMRDHKSVQGWSWSSAGSSKVKCAMARPHVLMPELTLSDL